ncbi:MAG: single-stranded DNA-binding protein [Catenulispora sp.]|nr:single-stranded DNA-binding protein [Catenulispora sp.]
MNETTVTVVGVVCSEVRYSRSSDETPTARFQIRTTARRYDKRTGTWTEGEPSFYSAACYRALAEHVASSMGVGDPVVATGRLRISHWRRGEENMVSAEIDVQAIGHDLRCGTSVYRRSAPPARIPGPPRARKADGVTTGTDQAVALLSEKDEAETTAEVMELPVAA